MGDGKRKSTRSRVEVVILNVADVIGKFTGRLGVFVG